jgi:hypothetical protein
VDQGWRQGRSHALCRQQSRKGTNDAPCLGKLLNTGFFHHGVNRLLLAISAQQELDKTKNELLRLRFDEQVRSEKRKAGGSLIETAVNSRPHPDQERTLETGPRSSSQATKQVSEV